MNTINERIGNQQYQLSTKTLQQKIFNFEVDQSSFIQYSHFENRLNIPNFTKSLPGRNIQSRQAYIWKPKIKSKKLFSDPKFLLSLERKKIRAINGIVTNHIQPPITTRSRCFQGEKVKGNARLSHRSTQLNFYKSQDALQNIEIKTQKNPKPIKTPHLNFNLHHMINKKKTFNLSFQNKIKGSNMPYYQYFFDKQDINISKIRVRNTSRPSKTADICLNRS